MISGSVEHYRIETTKRLGVLYNKHHSWLMACAYNKSKDIKVSEDLVQDLFLYLGEKNNPYKPAVPKASFPTGLFTIFLTPHRS